MLTWGMWLVNTNPPPTHGSTQMSIFAEDYTKDVVIEDTTITIKKLSLKDQLEASKKFNAGDEGGGSIELLIKSIVKWDVKGKDGNIIPIDEANIGKIRGEIAVKITEAISDYNSLKAEEVKN